MMNDRFKRTITYIVVVAVALLGQKLIADETAGDAAEREYRNSLAACERGNTTLRDPLTNFFAAFAADESEEHDDAELLVAIDRAVDDFEPIPCSEVIEAP